MALIMGGSGSWSPRPKSVSRVGGHPLGGFPVRTGAIDLEAIASNREQLFAEALLFYQDRPADWWKPPPGLQEALNEEREDRRDSSCWEEPVQTWLEDNAQRLKHPKWISLGTVLHGALDIKKEDWPRHQKAAGQVMKTLGWTYARKPPKDRKKGDWARVWIRPRKDTNTTS